MARLTPQFSANRTVREYAERYHLPAAQAYRERARDQGLAAREIVSWRGALERKWPNLRFGDEKVLTTDGQHAFEVQLYLSGLDATAVRVELYADAAEGGEPVRQEMTRSRQLLGANGYTYSAKVSAARPATDYTARVVPHYPGAAVPLEADQILWQR